MNIHTKAEYNALTCLYQDYRKQSDEMSAVEIQVVR